uniref:RNA-directed DNA polymerase, eukaryota n=1 Tax=Tanacetum cinerariifolium TaxID=118510 RepID=A0A6L2P231_TANCI|nr:RNA-directed DNA polymerase, eukaryota [Tanacetum cinerariifolium]
MARVTGCASGAIPFIYLGLPIGSNMNLIANWQSLIDRFRGELSSWKANLLSIGAIHGVDAGMDGKGCKSKGMWEKIVGSYSQLHAINVIPISTLHHKVGCGSSTKIREPNEEALMSMVAEIGNVTLSNQPDYWHWNIDPDGIFSVNATRNHIDDCLLPSLSPSSRWSKFLPGKRFLLLHALSCIARVESNDHILFGCDTAIGIWRLIHVWIDVSMSSFSSYSEWFQWIEDWRATKDSKDRIQATRTKNKKTIVMDENEILTREIQLHMKPWVDIFRENTICLGGHKDHVSACICHMLYCIEFSTLYNLAFFILKRMEKTRNKPKELLPYGMLLTRFFKYVVSVSPRLVFDHYISHDRAVHPLAPHYERKTRSDHGKKRPRETNTSSSSSFTTTQNHPSLSLPLDATGDENDDESFHCHSFSPSQNISSSFNVFPRVHQNLPHESHDLNTYLSETINI